MLLEIQNVTKAFGRGKDRVDVLRGVSLDLKAGETLALTGESGSGKSTLMHIAAGLEPAGSGKICLNDQDLTGLNDRGLAALRMSKIALVFQQFNLVPSLTVAANISFHANLAGRADPDFTQHLIQALGLDDQLRKYPEALSGGQQQRVAIARSLAVRPELLLADEPTGNLDEATADIVLDQMLNLVRETGAGCMLVTHSSKIAARMDRQLHLQAGRIA